MGIEDKGWIGGGGSAADAMWDSMWDTSRGYGVAPGVTEGPLAEFRGGVDPVAAHAATRAQVEHEMTQKTARVIGSDNNFDGSPQGPGGNRTVQQDTSAAGQAAVEARPQDSAKAPVDDSAGKKPSGAPSKGAVGAAAAARIKARRSGNSNEHNEQTSTQNVGRQGEAASKHNLIVREGAPVPKELKPESRVGNLADNHEKSSWTGSGPEAALHDDYSKVGALDRDMAYELLKLAGVPGQYQLADDSALFRLAASAAEMVKSASDIIEYLQRDDVHPLKLVAELEDALGPEWSDWEPETIRQTVVKEAGVEPSDDVMAKVMAVKIVLARPDRFFDDAHAFEKISVALNDQTPIMNAVEDVPVEWLSNAVTVVEKLAGGGDFSPEVTKYVAARLFDQGYVVAPPKLAFADRELGGMVGNDDLRHKVILAYPRALNAQGLDAPGDADTPVEVQVRRLVRNHAYVLDRIEEGRAQLS